MTPRRWLARLTERLPLAIVTGRPRAEAEWFLDRFRLRSLFEAVIAREAAPAKPDPRPVHRALETLGVDRAWMIGDTPDDVAAASGAGVVPIGVPAPGEDGAKTRKALARAGAATVLDRTTDLEDLL